MEMPGFDLAWRGFHRAQVREFVREVEAELRRVAAERDAAIRQGEALAARLTAAYEENRELRASIDRISRVPIAPDALQERSRRMLEITREEADEITMRATEEAARLKAEHEALVAQTKAERDKQRAEHEDLMRRAAEHRRKLDEEAAQARDRITTDFELAMKLRRAEAMRALAEQDEAAQARARKLLDDAAEKGRRLVAEAQAEADVALKLREDVLKQLLGARELVAEAGAVLSMPDDEPRPAVPAQRRNRPEEARTGTEAATG